MCCTPRAYALERLDGTPMLMAVIPMILDETRKADWSRQPSAGLGEDIRLRSERVLGSGLELEGELLQLSSFLSADGHPRATGRIARPSRRQ